MLWITTSFRIQKCLQQTQNKRQQKKNCFLLLVRPLPKEIMFSAESGLPPIATVVATGKARAIPQGLLHICEGLASRNPVFLIPLKLTLSYDLMDHRDFGTTALLPSSFTFTRNLL